MKEQIVPVNLTVTDQKFVEENLIKMVQFSRDKFRSLDMDHGFLNGRFSVDQISTFLAIHKINGHLTF